MAFTKTGDKTKAQILAGYATTNKVQWNKNLNFHALKAILTASEYIPAVAGDWATAPTTVDAALDELAARADEFLTDAANADKVLTYATTTGAPTIAKIADKNVDSAAAIATSKLAAATQIGYLSLGGTITTGGAWTQTGAHTVGITTSGATTVTLPQTGTLATLGGAETFSGAKTFTVKAVIDNDVGVDFRELTANGTNKVLLKGPSDCLNADKTVVLPNHSCTLPAADGTSGQFIQTNGSGVWSFATAAYAEKTVTKTIAAATLAAMNGAVGGDVEVLAAQAGVVYVPVAIQIFADFDTAEYGAGDDCVLVLGTVASGTVVANIDKAAIIPGTNADAHTFMYPEEAIWGSSATAKGVIITGLTNKPISFNVKSGGTPFTNGATNGDIKVKVYYREVALLT
jgi:hypothetical protein